MRKAIAGGLAGGVLLAGATAIGAQSAAKSSKAPEPVASASSAASAAQPQQKSGLEAAEADLRRQYKEHLEANKPRKLNAFNRWRYDTCREKAAQAPTEMGVRAAMALCKEKYGQ